MSRTLLARGILTCFVLFPLTACSQSDAARTQAQKTTSANNLREIGLALNQHSMMSQQFPAQAKQGADAKPLLSWRVMILPFLDGQALYSQFKLDEPWDSEHNKPLADKMPDVFNSPKGPGHGLTVYQVPVGPGTVFEGNAARGPNEIPDGMSNTILVVETPADKAVPWTKPDDWQFDPTKPLTGLADVWPDGFQVVFADGSVATLNAKTDPAVFKALLTRDGGEVVQRP